MNYTGIKWYDVANGPGARVSLFVSGCPHHCPACFNSVAWNYLNGERFTATVEDEIIKALHKQDIDGLSLLGGEPFAPANQVVTYLFVKHVRKVLPHVNIWAYSGYTWEQLINNNVQPLSKDLLLLCDVLVDGPFIQSLRDVRLQYRGSSNQRIIMVQESCKQGAVVLWNQKGESHETETQ